MGSVRWMVPIGPQQKMYEKTRISSNRTKASKGQLSTHTTDNAVSFRVLPTDAHSRRSGPDNQSQPASGLLAPQQTLAVTSAQFWRTQVSVLHVILADLKLPRSTRTVIAAVRVHLVLSVVACSSGRRSKHPPSADGHCLGTGYMF